MNPAEFQNIAAAEQEMWWFAGMRQILEAWIARLPGDRLTDVLEAGCGTGYLSQWLARRYGWRMFPVDLDEAGLRYGLEAGLPRLVQTDIARLPYRDACFDGLVSLDVLVHFPRGGEREALREFARVLRPGGKLILRVSALDILRSRHSQFAGEKQRFDAARLRGVLEETGFRVLDLSAANSLLLPVALLKFRVWEEWTQQAPRSGVEMPGQLLNRLLRLPLEIEAGWIRMGGRFPIGQSLLVLAEKS
ncbi:class I SAM-dependent methyltransferase [Bryobacter aggregatus]|uniref:class I SAM-dependent methyltransferase n=1 Tax=Bryobacter aggregatus TaxID=360054 RepID=UPI0004E24807|nr:class I SAM-dependent methyltransferase [Bryobacter aggregatus]